MVSTDADGTKEAMAIVDWLFDTLGAIEYDVSLSFTFPGGNGGRGAAGAPIMRWIDLSKVVNNFPTRFPGAKLEP